MCLVLWAVVSMLGTLSQSAQGWTDEDRAIMLRGVEAMENETKTDLERVKEWKDAERFADEKYQTALANIIANLEAK